MIQISYQGFRLLFKKKTVSSKRYLNYISTLKLTFGIMCSMKKYLKSKVFFLGTLTTVNELII